MRDFAPTLTASSTRVEEAQAEHLARERYGVVGRAPRQAGERDDNFLLETADGPRFLKVVHAAEPAEVTDLVTEVLRHLEASGEVPVQRVILARDGGTGVRVQHAGEERGVRLSSYVPGRLLRSVPSEPRLERELGALLARVGRALADFRHPAADRDVLWDLWSADRVGALLGDLPPSVERGELEATFARFEEHVRPRLATLRRGLVHNDLSPDNVVVDGEGAVSGLIDFGDATVTQLVNDVAIAMTNRLSDGDDPLAAALELLRGFHAEVPLEPGEAELLHDLIRTRTAMRVVISSWRAERFPDNATYILRETPRARAQLARLTAEGPRAVTDRIHDVLEEAR